MSARRSLPIERYQVGVVRPLPHEMTAAIAILDERHQQLAGQDKFDENNYVLGRVHEHNVIIACLPAGVYGTVSGPQGRGAVEAESDLEGKPTRHPGFLLYQDSADFLVAQRVSLQIASYKGSIEGR